MSNYPNYNPYQTPSGGYGPSGYGYGQPPSNGSGRVMPVAICLISVNSLSLLFFLFALVVYIVGGAAFAARQQFGGGPNALDPETQMIANIGWAVFMIVINSISLFGSIMMLKQRSYALSMTAAVLNVIPCCAACYILGIPFGIWAIVMLSQQDVKLAFRD